MTVKKSFGYGNASRYNSATFNANNDLIFGRNGTLGIGDIFNSGADVIFEDIVFIQNGIIVQKIGQVSETFPVNLPVPFYLTATVPDSRQIDNITWSFVRRPQDIGSNTVLIAEYDGDEWRKLPSLSIDGIHKHRLVEAIAYQNLGFNTGFVFSPNPAFTTYELSGGVVTDKSGVLVEKLQATTFTALDADTEYDRYDALFWRRPQDNVNRIGTLELRPGPTFSGASIVQNHLTTVGTGTNVNSQPKIINFSDNTFALFWLENYSTNGVIKGIKYDVDRTSVLVTETTFDSEVFEFDAIVDKDDNIMLTFIKGGNLYREKLNSSLSVTASSTVIDGLVNDVRQPTVRTDFIGNFYITFLYEVGPGVETPYLIKLNTGGSIIFPSKRLLTSANNYTKVHFDVSQDFLVFVAFENATTGKIEHGVFDEFGVALSASPTVISNDTLYGLTTLTGAARNPHVHIAENNELYISFEQNKGAGQYGIAFFSPIYQEKFEVDAILKDLDSSSENFTNHTFYLDWSNHAHILASDGTDLIYFNLLLPFSNTRLLASFTVRVANVSTFDIVYDKAGSLIVASADESTSVSNNGPALSPLLFGPDTYGSELEFITSNELAVESAYIGLLPLDPTIGDSIVITGSTAGNNGTVTITGFRDITIDSVSHRVYITTGSFSAEDSGGVSPQAQFTAKDGTVVQFSKQTSTTSYNFQDFKAEELDSDIFAVIIKKSDNSFITWYDQTLAPVGVNSIREESILTSSGSINWDASAALGTLTWSQHLYIRDPFRGSFKIEAGNMTNFVENSVLYVKSPIAVYFEKDGDADGFGVATVPDTSQFSIGQTVFIGDSDTNGLTAVVSNVTTTTVVFGVSLSYFSTLRGAYVIPIDLVPQLGLQNVGVLRPDSQGFIDKSIYVVAMRANDLIHFRNGALTLEDGEDGNIGDGPGDDTLAYIGATSDSDSDPDYINNYLGPQGQNLTGRLGAADKAANETAQDRNVLDIFPKGIAFTWDADTSTLTWANADWFLSVPDVGTSPGTAHTISTVSKTMVIGANQVAYVDINRTTGEGDLTPVVVNDNALPLDVSNQSHLVIARRKGDEITIGIHGKWVLVDEETSAYPVSSTKLIKGGNWTWDEDINTLTWDSAAYIQLPGLANSVNSIAAGSGTLSADGDVLYVNINRASPGGSLSVISDTIANVGFNLNNIIIARRIGVNVLVGHNLLEDGATIQLDQAFTNNMLTLIGFNDNGQTTHTYSSTYYITQNTSHEEALGLFDLKFKQIQDQLDKNLDSYIWLADGLTDSFTVNISGHGDGTITFSSDNTVNDIMVTVDGRVLELHTAGTWPIGDGDTDGEYIKVSANTIRIKPSQLEGSGTGINRSKVMVRPYAAGATHVVAVQDESLTIDSEVRTMNFTGPGVTVIPTSPGVVEVNIPGGGGGGGGGVGTSYTAFDATNNTGGLIPARRLVQFLDNGEVELCDNVVNGRKTPMAVTLTNIADTFTVVESVAVGYLIPGVLTGLGFSIGDRVFLGANGEMVTEANVPDSGAIDDANVQVGFAYGTGTSATDLVWNMMEFPGF
jgi:hypothetical protein